MQADSAAEHWATRRLRSRKMSLAFYGSRAEPLCASVSETTQQAAYSPLLAWSNVPARSEACCPLMNLGRSNCASVQL